MGGALRQDLGVRCSIHREHKIGEASIEAACRSRRPGRTRPNSTLAAFVATDCVPSCQPQYQRHVLINDPKSR